MGLYDYISCSINHYDINESEYYQTKDLDQTMSFYHISSEGLLYKKEVNELEELVVYNYTGIVNFYKYDNNIRVEYIATFRNGVILALVQTQPIVQEIPINKHRALILELMELNAQQMEIIRELDQLID